jgi:hypothetical protein
MVGRGGVQRREARRARERGGEGGEPLSEVDYFVMKDIAFTYI